MLILRCVLLGELPRPLPGARLSGCCLSSEAPAQSQAQGTRGGTATLMAASYPALESAPAVTTTAPRPQGPGCSGDGGRRSDQLRAAQW